MPEREIFQDCHGIFLNKNTHAQLLKKWLFNFMILIKSSFLVLELNISFFVLKF